MNVTQTTKKLYVLNTVELDIDINIKDKLKICQVLEY